MSFYGTTKTWKVIYYPKDMTGGKRGIALIEAQDKHHAMYTFGQQYAGQYTTVDSCTLLG